MKKIILLFITFLPLLSFSQEKSKVVGQSTVKRVSVGAEFYEDFWLNKPDGMDARAINQGAGTFFMYNFPFGKSPLSFAIGAGFSWHNLYSNTTINNIKADTIVFTPIPDSIGYKKSKIGMTYLDFPLELRLKTNNKIRASIGIKIGVLVDAKTKYKGNNENGDLVIMKEKQVGQLERWQFGPVVRFGYDWFHVMAYYSITNIFTKGKGPELSPVSLGITFMPF